jgi:5-formyltetrahydrofolate cyclo-ligase
MDRISLRKELRKIRQAFVLERQNCFFDIAPRLRDALPPNAVVAGYVSNGKEPDTLPWLELLAASDTPCALPHIKTRDSAMGFRRWSVGDTLCDAPFGFLQPSDDQATASPDIILTPLLGFDRAGNRIGQGAGHYDRYFAEHPQALRVGVAWSVQEVKIIPVEPWDMPLDAIITEAETILTAQTRIKWL